MYCISSISIFLNENSIILQNYLIKSIIRIVKQHKNV